MQPADPGFDHAQYALVLRDMMALYGDRLRFLSERHLPLQVRRRWGLGLRGRPEGIPLTEQIAILPHPEGSTAGDRIRLTEDLLGCNSVPLRTSYIEFKRW